MELSLKPCQTIEPRDLHHAMAEAFADYLVPLSLSFEAFQFMLAQRGYVAALSWVARVEGRIAAFWLIGVDVAPGSAQGSTRAYVIATGTRPQFRGRGLARQLYHALHERLAAQGKTALSLEVIEGNDPARKLYDSLGFQLRRRLLCFDVKGAAGSGDPA